MKPDECYIGQRVVCVAPMSDNKNIVGKRGTVVAIRKEEEFKDSEPAYNVWWAAGVEFDEEVIGSPRGHSCDGKTELGHGYWVTFAYLEEEEEELNEPDIKLSFDNL